MANFIINSGELQILYSSVHGGYDIVKKQDACDIGSTSPTIIGYILSSEIFSNASGIYTTNTGTTRSPTGWYSSGGIMRYWDKPSGNFTLNEICA